MNTRIKLRNTNQYPAQVHRGDVFFFNKDNDIVGSEQNGGRPGIVVSNDVGNWFSGIITVVYTTTQDKPSLPTHTKLNSLYKESIALCEQIHTLSKQRIVNKICKVTDDELEQIDNSLITSLGLPIESLVKYVNKHSKDYIITKRSESYGTNERRKENRTYSFV